jgi:hypothetical protein
MRRMVLVRILMEMVRDERVGNRLRWMRGLEGWRGEAVKWRFKGIWLVEVT